MHITIDRLREAATKLTPEQLASPNPYDDFSKSFCVYTTHEDKHCVAGQLLVNLGVEVPENGSLKNHTEVSKLFDQGWFKSQEVTIDGEAEEALRVAQSYADGNESLNGFASTTWEEALSEAGI